VRRVSKRCGSSSSCLSRINDQVVELVIFSLFLCLNIGVPIVELLFTDLFHLPLPAEHLLLLKLVLDFFFAHLVFLCLLLELALSCGIQGSLLVFLIFLFLEKLVL